MDVVNNPGDAQFYKDILTQMHDWFRSSCDRGQENVDGANSMDAVSSLRGSLSSITDPGTVTALFVEVVQIGEGRPHPSRQQSQYLVVRLRMLFTDRETHLILFDDQLRLASLWRTGMVLLLFRPYVVMNIDEALFGSCISVAGPMTHSVVTRAAPELAHLPHTVLPVHLLYGAVTVVAAVSGIIETKPPMANSSSIAVDQDTNRDQGSQLMRLLTVEWPAVSSEGNEARNTPSSPTPKMCHANKKPRVPTPYAIMLLAKMGAPVTLVKVAVHLPNSLVSGDSTQHQLTSALSTMRSGQLLLLTGLRTPITTSSSSSSRGATTVLREEDEAVVERYFGKQQQQQQQQQQHQHQRGSDSRLLPSDRVVPWLVLGGEAGSGDGNLSVAPSSSSKAMSASIGNISRLAALTTSSSLFPGSSNTTSGGSCNVFGVPSMEGLMVVRGRFTQWRATSSVTSYTSSSSSSSSSHVNASIGEDKDQDITIMATLESIISPGATFVCYLTAQTLVMSTALSDLSAEPSCCPSTAVVVSCLLTRVDDVAVPLPLTMMSLLYPQDSVSGLPLRPVAIPALLVPHPVNVYRVEVISDVPIQSCTANSRSTLTLLSRNSSSI